MSPEAAQREQALAVLIGLGSSLARGEILDDLPVERLQPDALVEVAALTAMLPAVGWWQRHGPTPWTDAAVAKAVDAYDAASAAHARRLASARSLAAEFAADGVPVAFRKGLHLAELYPNAGCRASRDIDIYIDPAATGAVADVVGRAGYVERQPDRTERMFLLLATNALPDFVHHERGLADVVDVSPAALLPSMVQAGSAEPLPSFLEAVEISPAGLPVLCRADLLVDLLINAYVMCTTLRYVHAGRFRRLSLFVDLAVVAAGMAEHDWLRMHTVVADHRLTDVVAFGLAAYEALFDESLGPGLVDPPRDVVDTIGILDGKPYRWAIPLHQRMLLEAVPTEVPASAAPKPPDDPFRT